MFTVNRNIKLGVDGITPPFGSKWTAIGFDNKIKRN